MCVNSTTSPFVEKPLSRSKVQNSYSEFFSTTSSPWRRRGEWSARPALRTLGSRVRLTWFVARFIEWLRKPSGGLHFHFHVSETWRTKILFAVLLMNLRGERMSCQSCRSFWQSVVVFSRHCRPSPFSETTCWRLCRLQRPSSSRTALPHSYMTWLTRICWPKQTLRDSLHFLPSLLQAAVF